VHFSDYLRNLRLEKAKEMLKKQVSTTITEIAFECGFSSLEYFISCFKKDNNGLASSQFRLQIRENEPQP